jgi:hypothetical protein
MRFRARRAVRIGEAGDAAKDRHHRLFDEKTIGVRFFCHVMEHDALAEIAVRIARAVREWKR